MRDVLCLWPCSCSSSCSSSRARFCRRRNPRSPPLLSSHALILAALFLCSFLPLQQSKTPFLPVPRARLLIMRGRLVATHLGFFVSLCLFPPAPSLPISLPFPPLFTGPAVRLTPHINGRWNPLSSAQSLSLSLFFAPSSWSSAAAHRLNARITQKVVPKLG